MFSEEDCDDGAVILCIAVKTGRRDMAEQKYVSDKTFN